MALEEEQDLFSDSGIGVLFDKNSGNGLCVYACQKYYINVP